MKLHARFDLGQRSLFRIELVDEFPLLLFFMNFLQDLSMNRC